MYNTNTNANANDVENSVTTNDRKKPFLLRNLFIFIFGGIDMIGLEKCDIEFMKEKKKKSNSAQSSYFCSLWKR